MKPASKIALVLLAWSLVLVPRTASAQGIHERFDEIVARAAQETGLSQIRTINLKINALLNETHFSAVSPDTYHWRTVDAILDSAYSDNCKDFVTVKQEALQRVGIESERVLVLLRSNLSAHVVLKARFEGREIILDNLRSVMVSMDDLKDVYEPYDAAPEAGTAYSPGATRMPSSGMSSATLVRDSRTSSANGSRRCAFFSYGPVRIMPITEYR
jgi:predicted transglutaminase-like cysteine proteinase